MNNSISLLKARNLFAQCTSLETLEKLFVTKNNACYLGIDPTAPSLHVGHLLGLTVLSIMPTSKKIVLIGGATAAIGDPSGRLEERTNVVTNEEVIRGNSNKIALQVREIFNTKKDKNHFEIVNNLDWTKPMNCISFLSDLGKHFRVNEMIKRDSAMSKREGLSFTELSYQILQANDFLHLYNTHGCRIQIGGSDQWGNIVGGLDLIRRKQADENVVGLTFPLVTIGKEKQKLGKSLGNAIWLNKDMTSDFDFYQYFLRLEDEDAKTMKVMFGVNDSEGVSRMEETDQKRLAKHMTKFVRGETALQAVELVTDILYGGGKSLKQNEAVILNACKSAGMETFKVESFKEKTIMEFLLLCKLVSSKNEGKRLENGIYLNGEKISSIQATITPESHFLNQKIAIFRIGKVKWGIVEIL